MNSTPCTPVSTMRFTALLPPPPTPMILTSVNPRAGDSCGASTICGTTDTGRVKSVIRSGLKPPRCRPLGTCNHLVSQGQVHIDRFIRTGIVKHRRSRRACFENFAVGGDLGAEHTNAPALTQVLRHLTLLFEASIHL